MVTDLLAVCAEGENINTESVCCTIFPLEELLQVIISLDVKLYRKIPFIKFLVNTYLNARQAGSALKTASLPLNRQVSASLVSTMCHSLKPTSYRKLWKFMDNSATLLARICDKVKAMSSTTSFLCKRHLLMQSWKYAHSIPGERIAEEDKSFSASGINGPTNEDLVWLPGWW